MIIVFIDPGMDAGLAIFEDGELIDCGEVKYHNFDSIKSARKKLERHTPSEVVVEATAWRASALKRCAKFSAGILVGCLGLQRLPLTFKNPSTWRKALFNDSKAAKQAALDYANEKGLNTDNHNLAEACCLGWAFYAEGEK